MFQSEYRQENEKSSFIADFGYTKGYRSKSSDYKRNGMSHILSKYNLDLDLENFTNSKLDVFFEKVTMDTFFGVFEGAILADKIFENDLKDHGTMTSGLIVKLDNEDYSFTSGLTSYESLGTSKNSDRYTYVLPYYNFSTTLFSNSEGTINFSSSGDNTLRNTNNLKSIITNNISYQTANIYSDIGFVSNYGIHIKNLNAIAKNDSRYRSSPQSEILNINEFNVTYPLIKDTVQAMIF